MSAPSPLPHVLILLASYNGARFLPAQLASIAAQEGVDWTLWVSDDGSTDETRALIVDFMARRPMGQVRLIDGPRQGTAGANFLHLLTHPDLPLTPETYIAFADQDDLWYPHKLARAVAVLGPSDGITPRLYGSQSRHVDRDGVPTGAGSRKPKRPVRFGNALVQNFIAGHAAVLDPAGVAFARKAGAPQGVVFHDWWLSQLIVAGGGRLVIDEAVTVDYRQHGSNTLGSHAGIGAALHRLKLLGRRDFANWLKAGIEGLATLDLPPESAKHLATLRNAPEAGFGRIRAFAKVGVERQSILGTLALYVAAFFGRA